MKTRPIIFSGAMVNALLARAKTQTRRPIRIDDRPIVIGSGFNPELPKQRGIPTDAVNVRMCGPYLKCDAPAGSNTVSSRVLCPYGVPGDRLLVKERWARLTGNGHRFVYEADGEPRTGVNMTQTVVGMTWRSPLFMPHNLSRITLEVTGVRVERVQSISEKDAKAEGVGPEFEMSVANFVTKKPPVSTYALGFKHAWRDIHDAESWDANPWVWVVEFKIVT